MRFSWLLAGLLAAALLSPSPAAAFCRTRTSHTSGDDCLAKGPSLYWRNRCVGYAVSKAASKKAALDKARTIVAASYAVWTAKNSTCTPGVKVIEQDVSDATAIGFNKNGKNENLVAFRDDVWPYDDAGNPLALTTVTFNADTGEILDADIEVNTADRSVTAQEPLPAQGYDLQSIITHEVGHYFGLAHSKVNNATMEARYDRGQIGLRTPEVDDQRGMCTIYPTELERTTDQPGDTAGTRVTAGPCEPVITVNTPEPTATAGCDCRAAPGRDARGAADGPTTAFAAASLGLAAAVVARRRRRP